MSDRPSADASWRDEPGWPDVDVVMPIRDEAAHLEAAIESVRAQEYPGVLRIVLGVGPSGDGTEALATRLARESGGDIVAVANPSGLTPAGLNVAIRAGTAPVIVRVDGHSVLSDGYVTRAVERLRATRAANVGGRQVPRPETPFEEAVAAATTSWLGTGGARYRVGGPPGPTDTVYLGVFDRAAIESVGLFDERLVRNQDYELNIRLRAAGHTVFFDPELWVGYRPRSSWRALARQYHDYGYWKAQVLRLHPESITARQLVAALAAPLAAAAIVGLGALVGRGRAAALVTGSTAVMLARPNRVAPAVATALAWSIGFIRGRAMSGALTER